jgi:hypothetical protein
MTYPRTTTKQPAAATIRLDALCHARLAWIKSLVLTRGDKPSHSQIIRRAVSLYVQHLDRVIAEGEVTGLNIEATYLRSHLGSESSPFSAPIEFDGQTFSELLKANQKPNGFIERMKKASHD